MPTLPTRRDRLRAQTLAEIRAHGLRQVDEGGTSALSLSAIAKEMGMTPPALYRYVASRDELRGALVTGAYAELTAELRRVAGEAAPHPGAPPRRRRPRLPRLGARPPAPLRPPVRRAPRGVRRLAGRDRRDPRG
jgi:AcrR family transcriptional regulator